MHTELIATFVSQVKSTLCGVMPGQFLNAYKAKSVILGAPALFGPAYFLLAATVLTLILRTYIHIYKG